jgi:hypothetical protein
VAAGHGVAHANVAVAGYLPERPSALAGRQTCVRNPRNPDHRTQILERPNPR